MKRLLAHVVLGVLMSSGLAHAEIAVGDRVFIPMYSEHLREDGYATGIVESRQGNDATIIMREVVPGKGKTLYGTCHPGATSPLSGAEIISDNPDAPVLRKTLSVSALKSWREGKDEYLERENVSTIFYKWLGDGMAVTPERARLGANKARSLGVERAGQALDLAALQVESTGGMGFPVAASQVLRGAPQVLRAVLDQTRKDGAAADQMRAILDGSEPMNGDDLLAMAMARVLMIVRHEWSRLPAELGSMDAAVRWADAPAAESIPGFRPSGVASRPNADPDPVGMVVVDAYVGALTSGGVKPYRGKEAAAIRAELVGALTAGKWPVLP
ncbi:MAG: hypothetical protein AB1344_10345 [Pseudomonadota bacterium]